MPTIFCRRAEPPEPGIWPSFLFRQRVEAGFRNDAEIAGQRDFETDAEAVAAIGDDHRLRATRWGRDVPGELGNMLGRGFHEAFDVAAAGKMLANGAQHDHADMLVLVERLEHEPQLVALRHLDHVERRAVKDDIRALLSGVQFNLEAVECREARIVESHRSHAAVPCERALSSVSNSPATSLRRRGSVTNRILLENYYLPGQLEQRIGEFVDYYNNQRYHENLDNLIPADVCFGRGKAILNGGKNSKRKTIEEQRRRHHQLAAQLKTR